MNNTDVKYILTKKVNMLLQKDETVVKSYEKQKFIYLVTRGEILE
jgi:hypothetical protein